MCVFFFFFFKQKTAYEIYQCDWSSDVCSSDLNLKELIEGLNIDINPSKIKEVENAIEQLNLIQKNKINFITLSEYGVFIKDEHQKMKIPAHIRSIADVSGAGDTVISVAALCVALNQSLKMIAEISNLAGGLVCESVGVVPIDKDLLLSERSEERRVGKECRSRWSPDP